MRVVARSLVVLVAAAVGITVGVLGAFVHSMSTRFLGMSLPLGLVLALAALVAVLLLTGILLRNRLPLLGPTLGWVIGVFPFAVPRPEGDLVVPGNFTGYVFLLGGALLIGMCLTIPFDGGGTGWRGAADELEGSSAGEAKTVPRSVV